jgi:pectin methylesterase-like acyl-CoA thioesterase
MNRAETINYPEFSMISPTRFATSLRAAAAILVCTGSLYAAPASTKKPAAPAQPTVPTLFVSIGGKADYNTVQAAVDAAPDTGAIISIAPGTYREIVTVRKPNITLHGDSNDPAATVIVDDHNARDNHGTFGSSTVNVYSDDFHADHISFVNDYNKTHPQVSQGSQALALLLEGDRAVIRHVDMLGNQDTLYAARQGCGMGRNGGTPKPCKDARSYYSDCLIAGNVDFIFGDGTAVFDHCEIRSTVHSAGGFLTAQSRNSADDKTSVYVFNHCTLTAEPGTGPGKIYLGRPWRPYAKVVYLHTVMGEHIDPAGWHEWHTSNPPAAADTHSLQTSYYAEYDSSGPGATKDRIAQREPLSHQLTAAQAKAYSTHAVLGGPDHWDPEKAK